MAIIIITRLLNSVKRYTGRLKKSIVEYEQKGNEKAEYGSNLHLSLSRDFANQYGKGFSKSNVYMMRLFYLKYQKFQTVSGKLSWSHYVELSGASDDLARKFYEKQFTAKRQNRPALGQILEWWYIQSLNGNRTNNLSAFYEKAQRS